MKGKWSKLLFSLVCRVGKKVKSGGGGRWRCGDWPLPIQPLPKFNYKFWKQLVIGFRDCSRIMNSTYE